MSWRKKRCSVVNVAGVICVREMGEFIGVVAGDDALTLKEVVLK